MVGGLRTRRLDEVAARSCGTLRPSPRAVHAARGVGVTVGGQHVARDPGSIAGRIAGVGLPSRLPGKRREFSPVCLAGLGPDDLPSSAESIVKGTGNAPQVLEVAPKPPSDIEYLQELIAIQQNGPKNIGFFGTRNMGFLHQQLIEILSYAMVLTVRDTGQKKSQRKNEGVFPKIADGRPLFLLSGQPHIHLGRDRNERGRH